MPSIVEDPRQNLPAGVLLLADSRFPAGGHAHSAGVEAAVRVGDVVDDATLERFLRGRLATTGVTESAFAVAAAAGRDPIELDAELTARTLSPRLRDVGRRLGRQLLRAGRRVWPDADLGDLDGVLVPVVLGRLVTAAGGRPEHAATVVMHQLSGAVTSAGVRLLGLDPLTMTAVQARTLRLVGDLTAAAPSWARSAPADLPALGGAMTEILGEDHGAWTARLFVA